MREVDEALRQDEMLEMAKRYGLPVLAVVIAGLLGFAGYLWWDHARHAAADKHGEELVMALDRLDSGNLDTADKQLASLAEHAGGASAASAKLAQADVALKQGHNDEAVKLFAQVAADKKAPKPFRDLATIREVAASFDSMKPQQIVDRLKPLAIPGNPWFGSAGELVGMAYLRQGKKDLAGPLFAKIARDKQLSDTLRGRARQMAGLLGVDAIDDPAKAAGIEPQPTDAGSQ